MEQPFNEPTEGAIDGPAAGWYPVEGGMVRYWDGEVWTDRTAPAPPGGDPSAAAVGQQLTAAVSSVQDQQMALFAHVGQLLGLVSGIGGFLVPLIIMFTRGKESDFVRRAAVESLNFWITGILAVIVSFILMFVLIGFVLLFIVSLFWIVMPIYAGIKAYEGVDYRYPFNLRFIR